MNTQQIKKKRERERERKNIKNCCCETGGNFVVHISTTVFIIYRDNLIAACMRK
jgi:hypothetical protein